MRTLPTKPRPQPGIDFETLFEQSSRNDFIEYWGEGTQIIQNPTVALVLFILEIILCPLKDDCGLSWDCCSGTVANHCLPLRAQSYAERLRLGLAVIHGEAQCTELDMDDGRHSPPMVKNATVHPGLELPCKIRSASSLFFFFKIYLFIMYTIFCLCVCLQARRGHQIPL